VRQRGKSSYGFLTPTATTRDAAHELGHGVFNLRHTFSTNNMVNLPEGTTQNLMDYSAGTELFKYQWDFIHNPEGGWFVWEDSEEGAMGVKTNLTYSQFVKHNILNNISLGRDPYLLGLASAPGEHITEVESAMEKGKLSASVNFKKDGKFSIETKIAVENFQKQLNYERSNGIIDQTTLIDIDKYMVSYEKGNSQDDIFIELRGETPTREQRIINELNNYFESNMAIQSKKI